MIKMGFARRLTAIVANLSLLLNSFLPFLLAIQPAYAQSPEVDVSAIVEPTPTPEPNLDIKESDNLPPTPTPEQVKSEPVNLTPEPTQSPEPTPTQEPTFVPTKTPTSTPTEDLSPTPEQNNNNPTETPTPNVELDLSPTPINSEIGTLNPTVEVSPTPNITYETEKVCLASDETVIDTTRDMWNIDLITKTAESKEVVKLGVKYIFPENDKVSVTFKCLPKDESLRTTLKIQQIKTSELNLPDDLGNLGEYAYDITTGMVDGTFEYDVTLPKPDNSIAEISYIEKSINDVKNNEIKIGDIKSIDGSKVEQQTDMVKAVSIDHFTIYLLSILETDFPYSCTGQCVSKDVKVQIIALVDSSGNPLICGVDDKSKVSYLKINYTSTASNRYSVYIQGNLVINGTEMGLIDSYDTCVDKVSGLNEIIYHIGDVPCGSSLSIRNLKLNWSNNTEHDETQNCETVFNTTHECSSPKCYASTTDYTITVPPSLKLVKEFGSSEGSASDWTLTASGPSLLSGNPLSNQNYIDGVVLPGTYNLSESGPLGYTGSDWSCIINNNSPIVSNSTSLSNNDKAVCTITNTRNPYCGDQIVNQSSEQCDDGNNNDGDGCNSTCQWEKGMLIVKKIVKNDNGGKKISSDFSFKINNDESKQFEIGGQNEFSLDAGNYNITEDPVIGYSTTYNNCSNVSLVAGGTQTCTITNDDIAPTLTLVKKVINNNGGLLETSDFPLFINGVSAVSGSSYAQVANTILTASETNQIGYAPTIWSGDCTSEGTITLLPGDNKTCTITNDDIQPKLTVTKIVKTGDANVSDFTLKVDNTEVISGQENGFNAGIYTVSESPTSGYTGVINGDCAANGSVSLSIGDVKSCTITNTRDLGELKVQKIVDDGSSLTQWGFSLNGGEVKYADSYGFVNFGQLPTGDYYITETGPNGYHLSSITGSCQADATTIGRANTTITKGNTNTCVFTNSINKGTLTIIKNAVPNDSQDFEFTTTGSGLSNFSLDDDGDSTLSNTITFSNLFPNTYSVTETGVVGWDQTSATCSDGSSINSIQISPGENITCTFTNSKLSIDVTKSASPTSIPETGGDVEYTVKVENPSAVAVNLTSLIDNKFGDITTISNTTCVLPQSIAANGFYECKFTHSFLPNEAGQTHTNTITATASGVSDFDDATVTFTDVAPDISVTKSASPISVPETGNNVTFTFVVSNIGVEDVILTSLSDSVFGDLNNQGDCHTGGTITVGDSYTCSITKFLSSDSLIKHTNLVTAIGTDDDGTTDTATDYEDVTFTDVAPSVTIEKSVTPVVLVEPGGTFTYTLKITNTSTENVVLTTLTDTNTLSPECLALIGTTINSGDFKTCSYTISRTAAGIYDNTAYVLITDNDNSTASDEDNVIAKVVGARINFNQLTATNNINDPHTFTVTVEENSGNGWINSSGRYISFTLVNNTSGASFVGGVDNCTTDTNGQCSIQINSTSPGSVEIHAKVEMSVLGASFDRETDGTLGSSTNATKNYEAGKIIIKKETLPDGDSQSFEFNPSWSDTNFYLKDGQSNDSGWLSPQTYSISEIVPVGWDLTRAFCSDQSSIDAISLQAGETITCTFNNTKLGSVSGLKWHDSNANGTKDSESGLSGWEIQLRNSLNSQINPLQTTTTNSSGFYQFNNLLPGDYYICEVMQNGYYQSYPYSGPQFSNNFCHEINLTAGQVLIDINFGNYQNATVNAAKWNDFDGDGQRDAGDTGIKDWKLFIDGNANNSFDEGETYGLTDINGEYQFSLKPGQYQLCESLISGWVQTFPETICRTITLTSRGIFSGTDYSFGNFQLGSISGAKFEDFNGNGIKDPNEPGLFGWTIYLDLNNNGIKNTDEPSQITDNDGKYSFSGLTAKTYKVREINQSGWTQTTPIVRSVTIDSGRNISDINFGNFENINITACKYVDENQDGNIEYDKLYDGGWNFYLDGGSVQNTGKGGCVTWTNLGPGNYTITEDTTNQSWAQTYPSGGNYVFDAVSGENKTFNFGNYQKGELKVCKYTDYTGNGVFEDSQDKPLSGINFKLYFSDNGWEYKTSLETGIDGCTTFTNLEAGNYKIVEDYNDPDLDGYYSTNNKTSYDDIQIISGSSETRIFLNAQYRSIEGYKFNDINGNGVWDDGEKGIENWTIFIDSNSNGLLDGGEISTITDEFGKYQFTNLVADSYRIVEKLETDWTQTLPILGYYNIDLHTDISSINNNFGNVQLSDIHGYKWSDYDGNGLLNNEEELLSGWTINLYKSNSDGGFESTPLMSMVTDNSQNHFGWYWFENLLPGDYKVCETLEPDWFQTFPINSDDNCHIVSLPGGNSNGFVLPDMQNAVGGPVYSFGNQELSTVTVYKFHDLNANGRRDENEPYLSDWEINVNKTDTTDTVSQSTDSSGAAIFSLKASNYNLSETLKPNWYQSNIYCEDTSPGVLITSPGVAYGHHGNCYGWNGCGDAATCALWACEANGYTNLVSYGEAKPCTQFNMCHLFSYRGSVDYNWGNWCDVMGVTDIKCSNGNNSNLTPTPTQTPGRSVSSFISGNTLNLNPGQSKTCYIGNYQKATITVTKDVLDHSGQPLEDNSQFTTLVEGVGETGFSENSPATYTVNPGTYTISEISINPSYQLKSPNDLVVTIISGENKSVNFINWSIPPKLTIAKSNNVSGDLSPGDQVEYTINLNIQDNDINNLKVTDLLSNGFKYKAGSYRVFLDDIDVTGSLGIPQPTYSSPGVWDLSKLGTLTPENKVKLTYIADISTDQQPGKYTDLAWAVADFAYDESESVLATAEPQGYIDTNFVGTIVPIVKNTQNSVSAEVEQKVEGQVLGASTELPATGASIIWLLVSSLIGTIGFALLKINKKSMFTLLLALLSFGLIAKPVFAADFVLSVQELKTPTNTKDLKLEFKALHLNNGIITVKCLKKGPTDSGFSQFGSNIVLIAGGNSSHCDLSLTINNNGSYQFNVEATDGVDTASKTVYLDYNTSSPGTPRDYRKENINSNNCDFKIHFRTDADNGKTVKVELYRSTDSAFSANNESLVHSVNIGSDQEYDILNNVPDCSKTYYYALRAFDSAGNGSGLTGDKITITTTTTTTETIVGSGTGAIPVIDAGIPSEKDVTQNDQDITTSDQTGQVLGSQKGVVADFVGKHKFVSTLIGVAVLSIIIYAIKKIRKNKKR